MACTYKFFTGDRIRKNYTGDISPFWCTALIFTCADDKSSIPPVVLHQRTHYTQNFHYNMPSNWLIQNSLSGYMDHDDWHKFMSHFSSMCCYSPINHQLIYCDGHDRHFDSREVDILCRHNIQYLLLNSGNYVHYQPNDNGPNMILKNCYGNARMNYMRHHGTFNSTLAHMNYVLVGTWKAFKLLSTKITQKYFKKTYILTLSTSDIGTNHQSFLDGTQQFNI